VVKRNITGLGGRIDLASAEGYGTRTTIRLPLTLAILDGFSVRVGQETYIVPLNAVIESLPGTAADIRAAGGEGRLLRVRGEHLPVVALHRVFGIETPITEPEHGILVLLEAEGRKAALLVDGLTGQHQVVLKNLESNYRKVPCVSGATIMGDGRVALILDAAALVARQAQPVKLAA
jgi:two-component system chemotaxis sensor kinase CheA